MSKRLQKIFKSRSEKIFSLLPNNNLPSEEEEDVDEEAEFQKRDRILSEMVDDSTLLAQTSEFLKFVGEMNDSDDSGNEDEVTDCDNQPTVAEISQGNEENITTNNSFTNFPPKKPNTKRKRPSYKAKGKTKKIIHWKRQPFKKIVTLPPNKPIPPNEPMSAVDYFYTLFDENITQFILEQTNLYYTQNTGNLGCFTREDILDFIAILIYMCIIRLPAYTDYWSEDLRCDKVASLMPLRKFKQIRRYLHFADISKPSEDRFYRIRELSELIRKNFNKIEHESRFSVDEQIVPYKGKKAGSRKQYLPKKPTKWGFKLYVRAGVSGMMYDFLIYSGQQTFDGVTFSEKELEFGSNAKVVLKLTQTIPTKPLCSLYFDNYFSCPELLMHLREEYGILSLCTLRVNRSRGANFVSDKLLRASGRGSHDELTNGKMAIIKWFDNKSVILASTYTGSQPITTISRYTSESRRRIPIPCPNIIKEYNQHMGGVDLADMAIALYRIKMKGRRWPTSLFCHFLDMTLVNAWLMHRRDLSEKTKAKKDQKNTQPITTKKRKRKSVDSEDNELSLKSFKLRVADQIVLYRRLKRSSRSPTPPSLPRRSVPKPSVSTAVRLDNIGHLPSFTTKGKCRHCLTGQTIFFCEKCSSRLCCVTNRNCFHAFHTLY